MKKRKLQDKANKNGKLFAVLLQFSQLLSRAVFRVLQFVVCPQFAYPHDDASTSIVEFGNSESPSSYALRDTAELRA